MKIIRGLKIGGLQHKIFILVVVNLLILILAFVGVNLYQQRNLSSIVETASVEQQDAITDVSSQTMEGVLDSMLTQSTQLQAYIAGDLFGDVRSAVATLQTLATDLYENEANYPAHPFYPADRANDGVPSAMILHEEGVDPYSSRSLSLAANLTEEMLSLFRNNDKLSSCFIGTADGTLLFVNDRAGEYFDSDGNPHMILPVRSRPWYRQAAEAGELIFTGLELDAFTNIPGLVCAAPVYRDGELVAVVGADLFLTSISEYVNSSATDGGFVCVISERGQVLFSPHSEGTLRAHLSISAPDLRQGRNTELGAFITEALERNTGLRTIVMDDKEYYMTGSPIGTIGWALLSAVEKEVTQRPTVAMLDRYDEINGEALTVFRDGAAKSGKSFIILTVILFLLAIAGALFTASRIVKPVEHMTKRINALSGDDVFEMEDVYRTKDEIEVLAESFASISKRTRDYIKQITEITAEKERIGTELALANQIQADMLPNIYPAFPDRPEFDVYASMDPAKEVGGDFYDFFLVDDDHLCVLIADVSGKGVPAALFMMASKIILANFANLGKSPAEILRATNDAICANNREDMFVTVWLGILEISTGKLTCSNAGHEYPTVTDPDGRFGIIKDKHGFVIGGMEGSKYTEYELQLEPGSKVFVYTDGVAEAMDKDRNQFGLERTLEALNGDTSATPENLLKNVRTAVDAFVKDAEQFDDLTMLALEYRGPKKA